MSRAFVKEDTEDRVSEELPERPISAAPNYVTPEGLRQLRERVEQLAREHALLKESSEAFDKPKLAANERDLRYFQARLESAIAVDVGNEPKDEVHFGATVKTEDEDGNVNAFTIVGEDEADIKDGKISFGSPIARALIGKDEGDAIEFQAPDGLKTYDILEVRYE